MTIWTSVDSNEPGVKTYEFETDFDPEIELYVVTSDTSEKIRLAFDWIDSTLSMRKQFYLDRDQAKLLRDRLTKALGE